jgi:hypothetical protein
MKVTRMIMVKMARHFAGMLVDDVDGGDDDGEDSAKCFVDGG